MWWQIFQGTVAGLVMASNVYWQWTPNGFLAAIIAGFAAYAATMSLLAIGGWCRQLAHWRRRRIGKEQPPEHREPIRW